MPRKRGSLKVVKAEPVKAERAGIAYPVKRKAAAKVKIEAAAVAVKVEAAAVVQTVQRRVLRSRA